MEAEEMIPDDDPIPEMDSSEAEVNAIGEESEASAPWLKRYFIHVETNGKPFQLHAERNIRGPWARVSEIQKLVVAYNRLKAKYQRLKKKQAEGT